MLPTFYIHLYQPTIPVLTVTGPASIINHARMTEGAIPLHGTLLLKGAAVVIDTLENCARQSNAPYILTRITQALMVNGSHIKVSANTSWRGLKTKELQC